MQIRLALLCVATLLFAACGDDESPPAAELSGEFQAGKVSGLRYVTPTRSGITDATGVFKYLPGESVTFSVGAIQLGHAPGASQITPFTLAGMTPPTTEPALRRELSRASRTTSNFVRAVNQMRLLLALDVDHNPANGIDLRGRDAALANATVDFDATIPQFAERLEKLAPDLTHNMPSWLPIVHLYRALGIAVPAHAPTNHDYDYSGIYTPETLFTYYPDGSLKSRGSSDSFLSFVSSNSYGYDALGRTTFSRTEQNSFSGRIIGEERRNYDSHGNLAMRTYEFDQGADGTIDARQVTDFETDAFANILGEVTQYDASHDGTIDRLETFAAQFDTRLNPDFSTRQTDANMDGVIDSRVTIDSAFDAANRPISNRYEIDDPADGVVDARYSTSATYAGNGRDVTEVYEDDWNADGIAETRATYEWVHDSGGRLRTLTIDAEDNQDGNETIDSRILEVITFDRDGRVLSDVVSEDDEADGDIDYVSTRTNTYDSYGNILETNSEFDYAGDQVDSRYVTRNEYGAGAELLGFVNTYHYAGAAESTDITSMRTTNVLLDDGVLMLAQSYLEFSFLTGAVAAF